MNVETLRSIIENPATTQSDRQAAREKLRALDGVTEANVPAPQNNPADNMAEQFLLEHPPLDPLSGRFLQQCGRATFLDITHAQVADFMQREWSREPDAEVHEEKYKRLREVWNAATLVRARFAMVYQSIDPRIAELLGLDVTCDPESGLADAKRKYAAIAANVDPR